MKAEVLLHKHPEPDAGRDRARAARQPVPLHGLRQGDRRDPARGRGSPRRAAPRARPQRPRRLAHRALPGHRAGARRQRVRRRHGGARDAPRRPPLLGPPAGAGSSASTRLEGARRTRASWRSLTAADVPGERVQGSIKRDWRQLVAEGEVTAYVGDVIAAVAAETRHAARAAAALVEVEYEVLEPVTDPFAALADGAPELHEGGNVLSVSRVQRGDVDAALAGAAHVVTESFRTQFIEHAFLEPESRSPCRTATARSRSTRRARASGTTAARSPRSSGSRRSACASRTCPRAARSARRRTSTSSATPPCSRPARAGPCSSR